MYPQLCIPLINRNRHKRIPHNSRNGRHQYK